MPALIAWTPHNIVDRAQITVPEATRDDAYPPENLTRRGLADVFRTRPTTYAEIVVDNTADSSGAVDAGFTPTVTGGYVYDIGVQPDDRIVIGGSFTAIDGFARKCIARLNIDGGLDDAFNPNANGGVYAITFQPDGKIIIGGYFTTVGGTVRKCIARLNADGTLDAEFDPNANESVVALAIQPDGKIIIGGAFTSVGGTARYYIARLNADGTLDSGFDQIVNGAVNVVALQPDGKIIIGGSFTTVGGVARNYIARLNADGTRDDSPDLPIDNAVRTLALQPDGKIIIGGQFTTVDGVARNCIARLNADGTLDAEFDQDVNDTVHALTLQPDGKIIIGGAFTSVGGTARYYIARLNADGTLDAEFDPGADARVFSAAIPTDGLLLVGGMFGAIGAVNQAGIARIGTTQNRPVRVIAMLGLLVTSGAITLDWRISEDDGWETIGTYQIDVRRYQDGFAANNLCIYLPDGIPNNAMFRIWYRARGATRFGLGRLWIGPALVLPDGVDAGWSMTFRDSGSLDATDGQQWVPSPGVITRALTIPLEGARDTLAAWGFDDGDKTTTSAMSLHALQLEAGTTGEVIAIARTNTQLWTRRTAIYGHIDQPWTIAHKAGPYWGSTLTIVEER